MIYLGIDPGKKGGIAAVGEDGFVHVAAAMPVVQSSKSKVEYDLPRCFGYIIRQGECRVTIERLLPMPQSMGGGAANYQRGFSMGIFRGFCTALKRPYDLVSPSVWQKAFWKVKADTKQQSILTCQRLFPGVELLATERSRKPHDGIADALLIAEYGRRSANGLLT